MIAPLPYHASVFWVQSNAPLRLAAATTLQDGEQFENIQEQV